MTESEKRLRDRARSLAAIDPGISAAMEEDLDALLAERGAEVKELKVLVAGKAAGALEVYAAGEVDAKVSVARDAAREEAWQSVAGPDQLHAATRALAERAEQAEKERDEAVAANVAKLSGLGEALQRAEASNAVLVRGIRAFHEAWKSGHDTLALVALLRLAATNSGAALLEYVRALEVVRETAEPFRMACVHPEPWPGGDASTELVLACSTADALKGKP